MYVSHSHKLVWARVPKTGSTAVLNATTGGGKKSCIWALQPQDWGFDTHVMFRHMPDPFMIKYADQDKYTFCAGIRHPRTWLPSFYNWIHNNTDRAKMAYCGTLQIPSDWFDFVYSLKVTPMSWCIDPRLEGHNLVVYKQEDNDTAAELFGIRPNPETNVTRENRRRAFDPSPQALALIRKKFVNELRYYPEDPL